MQQEHDGPAVRPGRAVEDVDAADGGGAVVDGPGAVSGFHFFSLLQYLCVQDMGAAANTALMHPQGQPADLDQRGRPIARVRGTKPQSC